MTSWRPGGAIVKRRTKSNAPTAERSSEYSSEQHRKALDVASKLVGHQSLLRSAEVRDVKRRMAVELAEASEPTISRREEIIRAMVKAKKRTGTYTQLCDVYHKTEKQLNNYAQSQLYKDLIK